MNIPMIVSTPHDSCEQPCGVLEVTSIPIKKDFRISCYQISVNQRFQNTKEDFYLIAHNSVPGLLSPLRFPALIFLLSLLISASNMKTHRCILCIVSNSMHNRKELKPFTYIYIIFD